MITFSDKLTSPGLAGDEWPSPYRQKNSMACWQYLITCITSCVSLIINKFSYDEFQKSSCENILICDYSCSGMKNVSKDTVSMIILNLSCSALLCVTDTLHETVNFFYKHTSRNNLTHDIRSASSWIINLKKTVYWSNQFHNATICCVSSSSSQTLAVPIYGCSIYVSYLSVQERVVSKQKNKQKSKKKGEFISRYFFFNVRLVQMVCELWMWSLWSMKIIIENKSFFHVCSVYMFVSVCMYSGQNTQTVIPIQITFLELLLQSGNWTISK